MNHGYQALFCNCTWSLPDGLVERHKARPVAQGFTQTPGVDYFDTFSPIVKPCTICLILALTVSFQWLVRQLDVENAFLNGELQEEVFMAQPQGFVHPRYPHFCCKLHKALYGLKQAPKVWFHKLRVTLVDYGFQPSCADMSLFIYHTASEVLILLVYADDILVTGSSQKLISHFTSYLHDKFALRDLGPLSYFLDLLNRTHMENSKPTPTPGSLGHTLSQSDGVPHPSEYRRTIGALQYVTLTRPDIAFVEHLILVFSFNLQLLWNFRDIVMLTRHLVPMIVEAPTATVSSSAQILYPGPPPNNAWSPRVVPNLNVEG
ncbi:Retrovirus-related Pol polyprotein from transposon RE2 [Vitis vinifera]|uniref:Retrovirus-related Pol polyprotein from transposon RE2 n=1 Tax=Vitis vinifera TaxID=29760 RepID=A0A438HWU5_VITVI|nr:Retrovirus-related Pol polyprotein from transposon RE2 [Vitis vinifera]